MSGDAGLDEQLFEAVRARDADACRRALVAGACPEAVTRQRPPLLADDMPALLVAAWTGCVPVVEALLDAGAAVDRTGTDWQTYAFNDDPTPFEGPTALATAAGAGHLDVVRLLLRRGASPRAGQPEPLVAAVAAGQVETARCLLEAGADPNARDGDDRSVLRHAVEAGGEELFDLVHAAGGRFCRQRDLEEARAHAGERLAALLEGGRLRDWVAQARTLWRLRARAASPEELLGDVMFLLHGSRGQIGAERARHERASGERRTVEETWAYGPWELMRTTTEEPGAEGGPPVRQLRLEVRGGLWLELACDGPAGSPDEQDFTLSVLGEARELDRVDSLLGGGTVGSSAEHLGDRAP